VLPAIQFHIQLKSARFMIRSTKYHESHSRFSGGLRYIQLPTTTTMNGKSSSLGMIMRSLLLIIILQSNARGQKGFELIGSLGQTFTSPISYQNAIGHISTTPTGFLSGLYHPNQYCGIELSFSGFSPQSYLDDPADIRVRVYTKSTITVRRLLAGPNFYVPLKRVYLYMGGLLGFSNAVTTQTFYTSSLVSFTWAIQTGVAYYVSKLIGLRLNGSLILTPNVSNNSAYFNVDKDGSGFPSFAIGDPSSANITQWNFSLGIIFRFGKDNTH